MKMLFFKSRILVSLSVVALFLTASVFARAGKQDFVLHNQTGVEINSLYVSPHDSNDWQEDILGQETLPKGESVKIAFDNRETKMHWDLKVTDKNGNSLEWDDLKLVAISEVTLHWDPKNNKGWADVK